MSKEYEPKISSAERLDGGVIVSFDNGRTAIYSAAVLYKYFAQAEEVQELDADIPG